MLRATFTVFGAAILATTVGCGGGGGGGAGAGDRPETAEATITVTQKGQPVEGATVTLVPAASQPTGAVGTTDASGIAVLKTYEPDDGAIPGAYKVTVTKFPPAAAAAAPEDEATRMQNYSQRMAQSQQSRGRSTPAPKNELPAKYADANTSGLTVDVKEGEANELKVDLPE